MGVLSKIGHVNFRVTDQDRSRKFYSEVLGMQVSEEDPQHGGVFLTFGSDFHNFDVSDNRGRMGRGERPVGFAHVAFKVESMAALREVYEGLLKHGVEIDYAMDHVSQRSIYFHDPDGINLEVYFEVPNAIEVFKDGRGDEDIPMPTSKRGEPLPAWILDDSWPTPQVLDDALAKVAAAKH